MKLEVVKLGISVAFIKKKIADNIFNGILHFLNSSCRPDWTLWWTGFGPQATYLTLFLKKKRVLRVVRVSSSKGVRLPITSIMYIVYEGRRT